MATTRREFLATASLGLAAAGWARQAEEIDVLVYGSTPGGIAAALEAARRGCTVVLACPKPHPGGMAASGLCTTDAVRRHLFGGFVLEFVAKVKAYYAATIGEASPEWPLIKDGWYYAPSVAQKIFSDLLAAESRLSYLKGRHLVSARVEGRRVVEVTFDDDSRVRARTFIDGTYEGDLAAAAKVPYRVAREGKDEHGEPLAGIHYMNWRTGRQIQTADSGEPSPAIQAFCARSIFTDDPAKRIPIVKPASYEQHEGDVAPIADDFKAGRFKVFRAGAQLPGRRFEFNGHIEWATSFNCPGVSWTWPEADRHHRARLEKFHVEHAASMMWFLQNDPRVPDGLRAQVKDWGLHADEFADTNYWPWQIYVRQGRRIEGRAKVTQRNFMIDPRLGRTPQVEHPIAVGEHSFDVHPCHDRRFAVDGFLEGVLWYPQKSSGPAQPGQIPWGALLPQTIDNLLVPVALSSTHVAMSVLRMEPVWMTTGQLAGLAAWSAKDQGRAVASIDPEPLRKTLGIAIDLPPK